MSDAPYLRAQAQNYLNRAKAYSEGWEASARSRAAECISRAEELEDDVRRKPSKLRTFGTVQSQV
jgi:hypothetical protein